MYTERGWIDSLPIALGVRLFERNRFWICKNLQNKTNKTFYNNLSETQSETLFIIYYIRINKTTRLQRKKIQMTSWKKTTVLISSSAPSIRLTKECNKNDLKDNVQKNVFTQRNKKLQISTGYLCKVCLLSTVFSKFFQGFFKASF